MKATLSRRIQWKGNTVAESTAKLENTTKIDSRAKMASTIDQLIKLAGHIEIVKHVPGEIQLKIKMTGLSLALNLDLPLLKVALRGIIGASKEGRVVTIFYDEKIIPKELWELLIKSHSNPKIQQLVKKELLNRMSG
jgi:hypothetical protein